jgi:hypothetical protein
MLAPLCEKEEGADWGVEASFITGMRREEMRKARHTFTLNSHYAFGISASSYFMTGI